jgi:3-methyladenine DNA glycosylase Mpg
MQIFEGELTEKNFQDISHKILNRTCLIVNGKSFRICEIEMYLHSEFHPDEYVHRNQDQQSFGKFYFHKYSTGTYKSGTWKGMDIVLGKENKYFGILIRSIMDLCSGEFIEGPCKCVNKVLEQFGVKTVSEMFENRINKTEQISLSDENLMISEKSDLPQKEIFVGKRIGLSDKYPNYKNKLYRFVIYENKIKKEKKTLIKQYLTAEIL